MVPAYISRMISLNGPLSDYIPEEEPRRGKSRFDIHWIFGQDFIHQSTVPPEQWGPMSAQRKDLVAKYLVDHDRELYARRHDEMHAEYLRKKDLIESDTRAELEEIFEPDRRASAPLSAEHESTKMHRGERWWKNSVYKSRGKS